jgi:hypothetical protein
LFQRFGHCLPLFFAAFGGKIQATRCAGGRSLRHIKGFQMDDIFTTSLAFSARRSFLF